MTTGELMLHEGRSVAPEGLDVSEQDNATFPVKPFAGVIVMVPPPDCPGLAIVIPPDGPDRPKLALPEPPPVTVTLAVPPEPA